MAVTHSIAPQQLTPSHPQLIINQRYLNIIIAMSTRRPTSQQPKVPFWKKNQPGHKPQSVPKSKPAIIDFVLASNAEVGIAMPYQLCDGKKKQMIKSAGGVWDSSNKLWLLQSQAGKELAMSFKKQYPEITINEIPDLTYRALKPMNQAIEIKNQNGKKVDAVQYPDWDLNYKPEILLPFYDKLFGFQQESVKFGVEHHGRILLADQMGVGKTIQALALAYIYKQDWPLLIVCPSSLKYNWQDQILRWYKDIRKYQIDVVKKKIGEGKREKTKIVIISYQLCRKYIENFDEFKAVIVDEAHYLKTLDSKRSEALVPFLKSRKRVLLLTGTPALAKPREIFNLLAIVRPDIYYNFKEFGNRYCDPQRSPWSNMIEYNGCKFQNELYFMIKDRIMIRRLKKEVLTQLPPKIRQKIIIECDQKYTKQIAAALTATPSLGLDPTGSSVGFELGSEDSTLDNVSNVYALTAMAKLEGVKSYLKEMIENDVKMIVFGHHRVMLDSIQELLEKNNVNFMRIDGSTNPEKRNQLVKDFQHKVGVRVALLSITAAGVGLTLTASSTVIFTELHWTPAIMFQAEDRAHRIGQPSCVNCHYLVGQCTLDDYIYLSLQKKFNNVSLIVDGQANKIGAQNLQKGQFGDVSKAAQAIKKLEQSAKKQKQMLRLSDYWKNKQDMIVSKVSQISSTQKERKVTNVEDITDSELESMDSEQELKLLIMKKNQKSQGTKRVSDMAPQKIEGTGTETQKN